jgi:CubicO group peptidase (beta-lactamase class C family)
VKHSGSAGTTDLLLGIDIGTASTKGVLTTLQGDVVATGPEARGCGGRPLVRRDRPRGTPTSLAGVTSPDEVLQRGIDEHRYAGVAAQVMRAGEVVHRAVLGDASNRAGEPERLWETAQFDIASCTKAVATTASVMALVGAGELGVDDALSRYLPSAHPDVTLRRLFTHTAGLAEWQPLYLASTSRQEAVRVASSLPLRYAVGEGRHYSDLGLILVGAVVEAVSGERLDAAVRRLVAEPLGMTSTGYGPVDPSSAVAYGHGDDIEQAMIRDGEPYPVTLQRRVPARWRHDWVRGEVSDGNAFHAMGGVSGHAGLFSTLDDMTRFGFALLDESPVWSRAVLDAFLAPGPDNQAVGFWWQAAAGGPAYGHPGFTGARFLVDPAANSVAVLLSNRLHVMDPGERVPPDIAPDWQSYLVATGFSNDPMS